MAPLAVWLRTARAKTEGWQTWRQQTGVWACVWTALSMAPGASAQEAALGSEEVVTKAAPASNTSPSPAATLPAAGEDESEHFDHPSRARLPDYMRWKRRMSQEDIDDKKEGGYFTGIPIFNYDTNKGYGFGGRGYFYANGIKSSPYFEYTPYRHSVYLQLLATTGGWQMHKLDYDGLYLGDSPYRLRASALYERNTEATYYGVGSTSMDALHWSGSGRSYSTIAELDRDLRTIQPDGTVASAYNRYDLQRPAMNLSVERDFLGGRLRVLVGTTVRHVRVATYDGKPRKGDDPTSGRTNVNATEGPTLLAEHCAQRKLVGCNGGWDNVLRAAVMYDTRDFEPDPNTGVFVGVSGQVSSTAIGSTDAYGRVAFTLRGFYSPIRRVTDLVLAGRFTYQVQSSSTPFYSMPTLTFPDIDEEGLGGLRSLRGYQQNRFVGPVLSLANVEVRWMPVKFRVGGQHFGIGVVPFFDAGRVYDRVEFRFVKWRFGYGGGLRIAWNQATIAVADYGISKEDQSFSITFGHHF